MKLSPYWLQALIDVLEDHKERTAELRRQAVRSIIRLFAKKKDA